MKTIIACLLIFAALLIIGGVVTSFFDRKDLGIVFDKISLILSLTALILIVIYKFGQI